MRGIVALLLVTVALIIALSPETKTVAQKPGTYVQLARYDAQQAGIDPDIFERQIRQESGFQTNVVSPAGAIGIAQFMPATARGLGINPWNAEQSLKGAAQLMRRYLDRYGNYAKALGAYNGGSGRVNYCMSHYDDWFHCLYSETQRYIETILQW